MAGLSEPRALKALDSSWIKRQVTEKAASQSPVSQQDAIHRSRQKLCKLRVGMLLRQEWLVLLASVEAFLAGTGLILA